MTKPLGSALSRDLASLTFQAPFVMAMRLQAMTTDLVTGRSSDPSDLTRMMAEKAEAASESFAAIHQTFFEQTMAAFVALAAGRQPMSAVSSCHALATAAIKPYGTRVRSNARRLTNGNS